MSLLGDRSAAESAKPIRERVYNAAYVYGPGGGITPSEFSDIKEGDTDRETGRKRCSFCRQPRPLKTGNGTTCDLYCEKNEFAGIPVGKPYPKTDRDLPGLEWLSLGT